MAMAASCRRRRSRAASASSAPRWRSPAGRAGTSAGVHAGAAEADAGAGALLGDDGLELEARLAGAAVLLGHLDAEDAQLAELVVEVARRLARPPPTRRRRARPRPAMKSRIVSRNASWSSLNTVRRTCAPPSALRALLSRAISKRSVSYPSVTRCPGRCRSSSAAPEGAQRQPVQQGGRRPAARQAARAAQVRGGVEQAEDGVHGRPGLRLGELRGTPRGRPSTHSSTYCRWSWRTSLRSVSRSRSSSRSCRVISGRSSSAKSMCPSIERVQQRLGASPSASADAAACPPVSSRPLIPTSSSASIASLPAKWR